MERMTQIRPTVSQLGPWLLWLLARAPRPSCPRLPRGRGPRGPRGAWRGPVGSAGADDFFRTCCNPAAHGELVMLIVHHSDQAQQPVEHIHLGPTFYSCGARNHGSE